MKRRTFVKKSIAASFLTPLALTGLINAAGAAEGGGSTATTWFTTEDTTMGYSYGPCVDAQGVGQYLKRLILVNVPGVGNVMIWHCFNSYNCYDSNGQLISRHRGPYSRCAGGDGCISVEEVKPNNSSFNLPECDLVTG